MQKQLLKPGRLLVIGYGAVSLMGALLLLLPWSSTQPGTTSFVQAWFTAMSALTSTGLVVVDTNSHWTIFGQIVIMLLVQIGGLGLMVFATIVLLFLGMKINLGYQALVVQDRNYFSIAGIRSLVRSIVLLSLMIELIGTVLLACGVPGLWQEGTVKGLFIALFHAVSAFNGAGFTLYDRSLEGFIPYPLASITVIMLVLLGSLGYVVLQELVTWPRHRRQRLSLHCRLVLLVTAGVTLFGAGFFFGTEYNGLLKGLPVHTQIIQSLFHATTRTAGFTTFPVVSWNEPFQFLMTLLMFIGASPGSVGGGIKTTTFAVIILAVWAIARGRNHVVVMEREIPRDNVLKAFTVTVFAFILVSGGTLILMLLEHLSFFPALFEVVSALTTAGLSMIDTGTLSPLAQTLLALFMFVGRIGVLTLIVFLTKEDYRRVRYMKEDILIG
ncbi:MAG TPA: hypothetical protein GXX34_04335 [Clostridia bacterium]|nr:hypothetical protein [Clostridia bacterium]